MDDLLIIQMVLSLIAIIITYLLGTSKKRIMKKLVTKKYREKFKNKNIEEKFYIIKEYYISEFNTIEKINNKKKIIRLNDYSIVNINIADILGRIVILVLPILISINIFFLNSNFTEVQKGNQDLIRLNDEIKQNENNEEIKNKKQEEVIKIKEKISKNVSEIGETFSIENFLFPTIIFIIFLILISEILKSMEINRMKITDNIKINLIEILDEIKADLIQKEKENNDILIEEKRLNNKKLENSFKNRFKKFIGIEES
ncbi:hypothetical protein J1C67_14490 [Clostridium gasigenes]|uniref:hypothetical protein n=1 Tax=Clostridium gasigenes TaxID=94869 RepID=UPI0014382F38|nr:hypothetical protein [Clostridium gasigenes]NKF05291.1 hypothetical protein [Clostridium gasigenes]QSW18746.1 hypothetical protein J1C67_14490 [Clostridium gasigenes]